MTILDPVVASNLSVYLVQLPRGRASPRHAAAAAPASFVSLNHAHRTGEVTVSETGTTERVHVVNFSGRDLFIQAGEVLRGGYQDRAAATDIIIPAKREPEAQPVPVFCVEEERWHYSRTGDGEEFTLFDQMVPGRKLKKEIGIGTQEDVWREVAAINDALLDIINQTGPDPAPPMSLWTLIEVLDTGGPLIEYQRPFTPVSEGHPEATGVVFAVNGKLNSAHLYASPALFRQLWPKLLWAMTVEALMERKNVGAWTGTQPSKGEITAWLAAAHGRRVARHTDVVTERTHRRLRSIGSQLCFETLDQVQDGLCVHEFILANE